MNLEVLVTSPYSFIALLALSISESAFFIVPPEVMLIPMALLNQPMALVIGVVTTLGSVLGGMLGYYIGDKGGKPILRKLFSEDKIEKVRILFHKYDAWAIVIAAFTPIPFKVFTIAAGVFDLNFWRFVIASLIGRGARYMLIAGLIFFYGESVRNFLEHDLDKAVLIGTIALVGVFAFYKFLYPKLEQYLLKGLVAKLVAKLRK